MTNDETKVQITVTLSHWEAGHYATLAAILRADFTVEMGGEEQQSVRMLLERAADICHPSYMLQMADLLETQAANFRRMRRRVDVAEAANAAAPQEPQP